MILLLILVILGKFYLEKCEFKVFFLIEKNRKKLKKLPFFTKRPKKSGTFFFNQKSLKLRLIKVKQQEIT